MNSNSNCGPTPIEHRPSFIALSKHFLHMLPLERAALFLSLIEEGYQIRVIARELHVRGVKVDESTIRRDRDVALLPESLKQMIREGESVAAVLKKAQDGGLLTAEKNSKGDETVEISPAKWTPFTVDQAVKHDLERARLRDQQYMSSIQHSRPVAGLDRTERLRTLHNMQENIGAVVREANRNEQQARAEMRAIRFGIGADGQQLSHEECLRRLDEQLNKPPQK